MCLASIFTLEPDPFVINGAMAFGRRGKDWLLEDCFSVSVSMANIMGDLTLPKRFLLELVCIQGCS